MDGEAKRSEIDYCVQNIALVLRFGCCHVTQEPYSTTLPDRNLNNMCYHDRSERYLCCSKTTYGTHTGQEKDSTWRPIHFRSTTANSRAVVWPACSAVSLVTALPATTSPNTRINARDH
ncbi:hypothetical protein ZHAS_00013168 [Anopheles sinensis]|uniref:Uncharacterized protein n=1 Tax=Anopheles sinensis TaxID=74873 RepID=A0A084W4R0_ANOSI|nr:hypothetical protein ZHAS_00013168 [Anopheles sinensis]